MADQQQSAIYRNRGSIALVTAIVGIYAGFYLLSPDKRWSFETETVVVEKTVHHTPWYFDATGPVLLLIIFAVIVYGIQGGLPRA